MAHEFSHGVAFDEGLEYDYLDEWAALHESFADCMAAIYDYDNNGDVWAFGEDVASAANPPLRQLDDPHSEGDADYRDDMNGAPHHDSGIPSLARIFRKKSIVDMLNC